MPLILEPWHLIGQQQQLQYLDVNVAVKRCNLFSGNSALAKQKILSIFHHVSNVHLFPAFTLFKKCEHEDIEETRPWIKAG